MKQLGPILEFSADSYICTHCTVCHKNTLCESLRSNKCELISFLLHFYCKAFLLSLFTSLCVRYYHSLSVRHIQALFNMTTWNQRYVCESESGSAGHLFLLTGSSLHCRLPQCAWMGDWTERLMQSVAFFTWALALITEHNCCGIVSINLNLLINKCHNNNFFP